MKGGGTAELEDVGREFTDTPLNPPLERGEALPKPKGSKAPPKENGGGTAELVDVRREFTDTPLNPPLERGEALRKAEGGR